ncbi:conserved hypothetical protein [Bordetella avium 197N]|uniref:Uncharacterized protein n=1 Tax=Bordetella avium (strain 197N) TaxID=360910 RepID=Q2KXF8_BORA1|nr:conserved hypothetical protein [Bordetella avium 197N]
MLNKYEKPRMPGRFGRAQPPTRQCLAFPGQAIPRALESPTPHLGFSAVYQTTGAGGPLPRSLFLHVLYILLRVANPVHRRCIHE